MNARECFLPVLALGGAGLLLAPPRSLFGFGKFGTSLDEGQRDVRVRANFADPTASDNDVPDAQFPGYTGLELAIWKAVAEWGSRLHGDGSGDPIDGNLLGDGGANFDAFFAGNAAGIGNNRSNIVSAISSCGGGVLAYQECPPGCIGWRIRFCEEWVWDDGPGLIAGEWDIQGVMAHEYGHALGLTHTTVLDATMTPAPSDAVPLRSLHADDIAGIQCIYGLASATKPLIVATAAGAGQLTIFGGNFAATDNEVWFTPAAVTAVDADPIVRVTGLASQLGGTVLVVPIPPEAGPGDVLVNKPPLGNATLSNAFPTDLVGSFGVVPGVHPELTSVTPATIEALVPGTAETITLIGSALDLLTAVLLDGEPVDPARYTLVSPTTLTLDMPQAASLGTHRLGVTDGILADEFTVTVVAPASPRLQWGNGDPGNVVDRDDGLDMILAGVPGSLHMVCGSPLAPPTFRRLLPLDRVLVHAGTFVLPPEGWLAVHVEGLPDPAVVGGTWFARSFAVSDPRPFPASNDQAITLVP